jgi:prepilin-type N-terminal cleavage/methylation domain-containing protein
MKASKGFTLIEVIVAIIIIAVAAALFISYLGKSFTQSPLSAGLVSNQYSLIQQMELITNEYRQELKNGTLTLAAFKTWVDTNYSGSATTLLTTLTSGSYTTQQVLQVTLTNGRQTLLSIFTQ